MTRPEFSILVPTRNRSAQIAATLVPLAHQSHGNYEIVVSDNSDTEQSAHVASLVEILKDQADIRVVRPDRPLNMVDHWNFALGQVQGEFVGIVTDRMTLLPSTLASLRTHLSEQETCVSYSHTTLKQNPDGAVLHPPLAASRVEQMDAQGILSLFASGGATKACPRLLNCFTHTDVLERMRTEAGEYLHGISPDYSFLFNYLARYASYAHVHRAYLVDHSPQVSNGMAATQNMPNKAFADFYQRMIAEQKDSMALRPIPEDTTLFANIILSEYVLAQRTTPGADMPPLDHEKIYQACWKQAQKVATSGNSASEHMLDALEKYRVTQGLPPHSWVDRMKLAVRKRRNLAKQQRRAQQSGGAVSDSVFDLETELERGTAILTTLKAFDAEALKRPGAEETE